MSEDTISRKAAIEALQEHRNLFCDNTPETFSKLSYAEKSRVDELDMAIATLINLPSAQPEKRTEERTETHTCDYINRKAYERGKAEAQQKWIPCSEREPEEYGEYRITWTTSASKKRFIGDSEYEVTDVWDADHYRFKGEWLLDDYVKNYPDVKVIAWKPLEEPYREGES